MFRLIEGHWPRQEHFQHYMNNLRCTYSLTIQIDITSLYPVLKARALKAYPVQIYLLATIVNRFPEFRMGLSDTGEPGYWDMLHPSYTVFNAENKTFSSIWTPYQADFLLFYKACRQDIEKYSPSTDFIPQKDMPPNVFNLSCLPWIDFTSFNLNVFTDGTHLLPIFHIGKYVEADGKILMPLALQLHHSACDGYHAGEFIAALRKMVQQYEGWLSLP